MAPKYTLTYFNTFGLAEPIRFLLSYGGVDFEDVRMTKEDWSNVKPSTPFGKVPMLEVDGKKLHQSSAICRYLGKQFGICGKDSWEAMQIDIVVDTIGDMKSPIMAHHTENDPDTKAKKKDVLVNETLPFYYSKFEDMIKNNGGFFVGGKLSWVDLYWVALLEANTLLSETTKKFPGLKAHNEKIRNLPSIKAWIDMRPNEQPALHN